MSNKAEVGLDEPQRKGSRKPALGSWTKPRRHVLTRLTEVTAGGADSATSDSGQNMMS